MNKTAAPPTLLSRLKEDTRLIWALFTKDVLEAMKNKNAIAIILSSLFMVLFYSAMPALFSVAQTPALLVYDGGKSTLTEQLDKSQHIRLYTYPSEEVMKKVLADGSEPELGLVIPAGFEAELQAGKVPELQGYVMRWVSEKDANELKEIAETEISSLVSQPVTINLEGNRVDLLPESGGIGETASFGLVYVVIMIGIMLVPHLMLEEKQSRTLDVLNVSPASAGHIVAGKALAGLFYCLLGCAVALAINYTLIVHWWLAILAALAGSLFTVSLGLLLGIKIDSRAQLSLWAWVFLLPLILPIILTLLQDLLPDLLVRIFSAIPTATVLRLIQASFANSVPLEKSLLQLAWVTATAGVGLAAVVWVLRRRDREAGDLTISLRKFLPGATKEIKGTPAPHFEEPFEVAIDRSSLTFPSPAGKNESKAQTKTRGSLAMIGIIAKKDLVEALKNRLILSILLGSTFIVLSGAALPLLVNSGRLPTLYIYDEGNSSILRELVAREDLQVGIRDSREEMESALPGAPDLRIGLILPADFDQLASQGQAIELQVSYPYWAKTKQLAQRVAFFEEALGQLAATPVQLKLADRPVYQPAELSGQPVMLLLNLVAFILVIGIALVPLLIIEEKEAQTLKVLQVSPASLGQVIAGKAFVGLAYSLLPAFLMMLLYHRLFIHWEVAILAALLAAGLAVAAGLLLGLLIDSPTSASLGGSLFLLVLLGSALMNLFTGLQIPAPLQTALNWLPGSAIMRLLAMSQAREVMASLVWLNASALLIVIAALALLMRWRLRRMETW